jgi:phage baseplate assembly protein W
MTIPGPLRHDYRFPLRINGAQRQAERVSYPDHVAQTIRQFLLTSPGERVCLPDFGGGLRRLIFAPQTSGPPQMSGQPSTTPQTSGLASTTDLLVRQGLEKYLGQHITVNSVKVSQAAEIGDGAIEVLIEYQLIETQTAESLLLRAPGS